MQLRNSRGGVVSANVLSGGIDEGFSRTDSSGAVTPLQDALGSTIRWWTQVET